jgi:acyl carrier protein
LDRDQISIAIFEAVKAETGLDVSNLDPGSTVSDLGIASMDLIMIIYAIEDRLGIQLGDAEFDQEPTLRDLHEFVASKAVP